MSEVVERVAKAILAKSGGYWVPGIEEELARAAIEAMREPTQKMVCAALDRHDKRPNEFGYTEHWKVMIDEALR